MDNHTSTLREANRMSGLPSTWTESVLQNAEQCHVTSSICPWDRLCSSHCKKKKKKKMRFSWGVKTIPPAWEVAEQIQGPVWLWSLCFLLSSHMIGVFGQSEFHILGHAYTPTANVKCTELQSTHTWVNIWGQSHLLEVIQEKTHFWLVSIAVSLCFRNRCWCSKARITDKPDTVSLKWE